MTDESGGTLLRLAAFTTHPPPTRAAGTQPASGSGARCRPSDRFRARDPFPVGGVVEDPATGAAAAALGAYLRDRGEITAPATFEIVQGVEIGRPSRLTVSIVAGEHGVRVSGTAVLI